MYRKRVLYTFLKVETVQLLARNGQFLKVMFIHLTLRKNCIKIQVAERFFKLIQKYYHLLRVEGHLNNIKNMDKKRKMSVIVDEIMSFAADKSGHLSSYVISIEKLLVRVFC